MEDLIKQLQVLIDKAEERKLHSMVYGLSGDIREKEGEIQAFKLVKLLVETNLNLCTK